jgi:hypothetical protein
VRGLAPRLDRPRSRAQRLRGIILGALGGVVVTFVILDHVFQIRESLGAGRAYTPLSGSVDGDKGVEAAIRAQIGRLLRPRDTNASIGGDSSARLIEAGLLYGRLAEVYERSGRSDESAKAMADGIALLKAAGHSNPTEAHIREAVARQDRHPQRK